MSEGVSVRACSNSLEAKGFEESDLVAGVEIVPAGAVEVMRLQTEATRYQTEATQLQTDGYAHVRT